MYVGTFARSYSVSIRVSQISKLAPLQLDPAATWHLSIKETLSKSLKVSVRERKRNPNPNALVRISSGRVGVFHVKWWGPESSVCSSQPRETKLSDGISRDFCRDIPGVPEKFEEEKVSVQFLSPKVALALYNPSPSKSLSNSETGTPQLAPTTTGCIP